MRPRLDTRTTDFVWSDPGSRVQPIVSFATFARSSRDYRVDINPNRKVRKGDAKSRKAELHGPGNWPIWELDNRSQTELQSARKFS